LATTPDCYRLGGLTKSVDDLDQELMCRARQPATVSLTHPAAQLGEMWTYRRPDPRHVAAAAANVR
jgi:hypothetical protein